MRAFRYLIPGASVNFRIIVPYGSKRPEDTHLSHIVHHTIQIELAGAEQYVLAGLLHARCQQRIRLVDLAKRLQHLRQLRRIYGLNGELHHGLRVELQRTEDVHLKQKVNLGSECTHEPHPGRSPSR